MGVQAMVNAVKIAAAWVLGFITGAAAAIAGFVATVATVVAGWVLMGVQAMINAVKIAAAWLIALGPVGLVIAAIVGLVALFVLLWKKSETFRTVVTGVWNGIRTGAQKAFGVIKSVATK